MLKRFWEDEVKPSFKTWGGYATDWWNEEGRGEVQEVKRAVVSFFQRTGQLWREKGREPTIKIAKNWKFWVGVLSVVAVVWGSYGLIRQTTPFLALIAFAVGVVGFVWLSQGQLPKPNPDLPADYYEPITGVQGLPPSRPKTAGEWLAQEQAVQAPVIDGQQLLRDTRNRITAGNLGEATVFGGGAAVWGCASVLGVLLGGGTAAILLGITLLMVLSAGPVVLVVVLFLVVAVVIGLFMTLNRPSREAGKAYIDPIPLINEYVIQEGGRNALDSEIEKIKAVASLIVTNTDKDFGLPRLWVVITKNLVSSQTLGDCIFLPRPMLHTPHLDPAVAHELARLNQGDGNIRLALQQLGIPQRELPYKEQWVYFWRQQVFAADEFVYNAGLGDALIRYLESYQPFEMARDWYSQEEPYAAERIERLSKLIRQSLADGYTPDKDY